MRYFHPKKKIRLTIDWLYKVFWYYIIPDSWYLRYRYKKVFGKSLNLRHPKTFNEKIQWLKLNDRNPNYSLLVDKYEVKKKIAQLLGCDYVIPTIGEKYLSVSEIDKNRLPEKFVLKCNHDAASVIVCRDKTTFNWTDAEEKIRKCLGRDYYHFENKQWVYKGIDRCVFVEQYIEDEKTHDLPDFKFYCFNGDVKCIFVGRERFTNNKGVQVNLYDKEWNKLPFEHYHPNYDGEISRPKNLDKMIEIAEKLAKYVNNPFIRIDLYDVNEKIYFGEFTFYPGGGFEEFRPEVWDQILGSWINLSIIRKK